MKWHFKTWKQNRIIKRPRLRELLDKLTQRDFPIYFNGRRPKRQFYPAWGSCRVRVDGHIDTVVLHPAVHGREKIELRIGFELGVAPFFHQSAQFETDRRRRRPLSDDFFHFCIKLSGRYFEEKIFPAITHASIQQLQGAHKNLGLGPWKSSCIITTSIYHRVSWTNSHRSTIRIFTVIANRTMCGSWWDSLLIKDFKQSFAFWDDDTLSQMSMMSPQSSDALFSFVTFSADGILQIKDVCRIHLTDGGILYS